MSYSVIGDSVNTGARLCSAAKAGQVIISEATYREVKDDFDFAVLEPVTAKGKSKPLKIYNVLGQKSVGVSDMTRPNMVTDPGIK